MTADSKLQAKKGYSTPSLQIYGNLQSLTKNTGTLGMGDGAMAGNAKT